MVEKKGLHVGIILDGNRRYATKLLKNPWEGHDYGKNNVESLLDWICELNIRELTLYCFSTENFSRPKKEVEVLLEIFKKEFEKLKTDKRIEEKKIKINFLGKLDLFDLDLQKSMKEVAEKTHSYSGYVVNFCVAYGGRQEIISAVKKLVEKKQEINEENLKNNLWLKSEPDFIIRTGNSFRTSNFLPWQSVYSEWIFMEKMWPEFTREDLVNCIKEFEGRERRFGK